MTPTANQAKILIQSFGQLDPGGSCWSWVQANCPDLWRDHQAAILNSDIAEAARTFKAMLTAWESKQTAEQPELLTGDKGGMPQWAI